MTDTPSAQTEPAAPAPASPVEQVTIGLGPDLGIYPDELRPAAATSTTEASAPDAEPPAAPPSLPADAGPAPDVLETTEDSGQGSRRQRGQEAYERGLAEGRAAAEQERTEQERVRLADEHARQATQRVEQLFAALESPDIKVQDQARQGILQLYRGNQQAAAVQTSTRQAILSQIAADFVKLRGADGIDDAAYEQLHTAPDPAELARRAIALGRKQRDDEVHKLEAELTQLRGRLVGLTASPQPANGVAGGNGGITIDQYRNMTPADARKLTPRQIDALTAEMQRELQNGRV